MSKLKDLIQASNTRNKELTPLTVRVTNEIRSFIDEFAENIGLSRQEVMIALLEQGIEEAQGEISKSANADTETPAHFHFLNTNKAHGDDDHEEMIKEQIAAAFYDPWKKNIDRLEKNDIVFLYENGRGVIAYGKASGKTLMKDCRGDENECYYQKLQDFIMLKEPLAASEIKKILGRNVVFLRTMSGVPDGQKILDRISGK